MIKQWTNDKGVKYLFVEVPGNTSSISIEDNIWYSRLYYFTNKWSGITVPKCNKIGLSKELTEEQRKEIVISKYLNEISETRYFKHDREWDYVATSATESGQSLLIHAGFKETDNIAVLEVTE